MLWIISTIMVFCLCFFFVNCSVLQPVVKVRVILTIASPNGFLLNLPKVLLWNAKSLQNTSVIFFYFLLVLFSEALYSYLGVALEDLW